MCNSQSVWRTPNKQGPLSQSDRRWTPRDWDTDYMALHQMWSRAEKRSGHMLPGPRNKSPIDNCLQIKIKFVSRESH